jgi:GST-like protein
MSLGQAMSKLEDFPITARWPAQRPEVIQLYSMTTPNGYKVSIMLEEAGLDYEPHLVRLGDNDNLTPAFLSLNPYGKIPAIIDPDGPGGQPMGLFESGAILLYLAEKSGKLLPVEGNARWQAIQWLMFQMGGVGPIFGQVGFFVKWAGREWEDKRPRDRYVTEARRLLRVIEARLQGRVWMIDEFTVADIAIAPWLRSLRDTYGAGEHVGWSDFPRTDDYLNRFLDRPAVRRGMDFASRA